MKECSIICDRCHTKESVGNYPSTPTNKGWKDVEIKLDQYNFKTFTLCPKCLDELGLIDKNTGRPEKISEPSIQEKIFDLLFEIANQAIDERGL